MPRPIERARIYGAMRKRAEVLPVFALELAKAAKRKEITADDAEELYLAYFKASTGLKLKASDGSMRANTSKLRQIIRAADPELLKRVERIRSQAARYGPVRPLYALMVWACGVKNARGRPPPESEIRLRASRPAK